jgi:hypothetical protein
MSATTTEPVKNRFKTLTAALDEIERLESQVIALNAALVSRTAAPAKAQTPTPPSAPAPVNQPAQAATPPAAKSLNDYSLSELVDAVDEANLRGDTAAANRFYRAYQARKLSSC